MRKCLFLVCILLLHWQLVFCQNTIGIPNIINHTKQDYRASSQNWDIRHDADGILYVANNDGLLTYDGSFWRLYPLPNKIIARSLAIGEDHRIYVGAQEEFGYFSPGPNGELVYTSLKPLIPAKDNDFADVWDICLFKKEVFFRSKKKIFRLSDHKIKVYNSTDWGFLGSVDNEVVAYNFEKGLVYYRDGAWTPAVNKGSFPPLTEIRAVIDIGTDSLLVASFTNGLFILHKDVLTTFRSPDIDKIAAQNISGVALLEPDRLAIITNLAGCLVVNKKGDFIRKFSKLEGLQNNNIQSLLLDKDRNLWLALENGIDMVTYTNAITSIFPEKEDRNSGYASILYKGRLYLGASTGVYSIALDTSKDLSFVKGSFEFLANTKGQVWSLTEVNGELVAGHNKGAIVISGGSASFFDDKTGFWTFLPLYKTALSTVVIAGTYNGINIYHYDHGTFINPKIHAQFESAKFVSVLDSVIWVAHSYKGLFKVEFRDGVPVSTQYKDNRHILSPNHNHLFNVRNKVILTTDKGTFEYDPREKDFVRSAWLESIFGNIPVNYILEDRYGNIWFIRDKRLAVAAIAAGKTKVINISELDNKIMTGGYEHINVIDSNNVLIAAEKGFFHINYAQYVKNNTPIRVLIRNVVSIGQKNLLLYGGHSIDHEFPRAPAISYNGNSLHFEFSTASYGEQQSIEYGYYLQGFDKRWSGWIKKSEKDYTNLPEGQYIFKVKCRNSSNNETSLSEYAFSILPPWYRSFLAYVIYGAAFCGLLYFFYKLQQRKYKRLQQLKLKEQQRQYAEEQQKTQFLHQIEVQENEKEIIHLTNAKLQAEIEHKDRELASNAMSFVQKGELLSKIKDELMRLKNNSELEKDSKDFKKIIRIIDSELDNMHDWDQFAVHFDSVHTDYLKNLKERFPDLTASELKLCAYLRLNLSTKEISQIMNISTRGVETSRYRLRKKLELPNDANLVDFLLKAS